MKPLQYCVRGFWYLIQFFVPAIGLAIEITLDNDVGEYCGTIVTFSLSLSIVAVVTFLLFFHVDLSVSSQEAQQAWSWITYILPGVCWVGSWFFYLEAKRIDG